jgi:hypothetical protein
MRGLTSLNWFIGACLIAAALLQPVAYNLFIGGEQRAAEATISLIAQSQGRLRNSPGDEFVVFKATAADMGRGYRELRLQNPPSDADTFHFSAEPSTDAGGNPDLIIRAVPSRTALGRSFMPVGPMVFTYQVSKSAGTWNLHGSKREPLFGLL